MIRLIISVLLISVLDVALTCCSPGRKSHSELRGLMLLENTQLGRNKSYYSRHKRKKISNAHKKFEKKRNINNTVKAVSPE
jgi:hypothetical protein